VKCVCGNSNGVELKSGYNPLAVAKKSGWFPVMKSDTDIIWLCPRCGKIVEGHARRIAGIIGDENIYFPSLIKE